MKTPEELRAEAAYVAAECVHIHEAAGDAELSPEDQARFDEGSAFVRETTAAAEKAEVRAAQMAELRSAAEAGHFDEPRFEPTAFNTNTRDKSDLFDLRSVKGGYGSDTRSVDLRARALTAIEDIESRHITDNNKARLTDMVENDGAQVTDDTVIPGGARAEHLLRTGSPAYAEAFRQYMRDPMNLREEYRTALSTTSANGGYLLPYFIDPTIIYTNAGYISPIRQLATVKQITTNIWHGVTSAGATAEWIGEATEVSDGSPTFAQPTITTYKADAYIQASLEVVADTNIGQQVAELLGEAKGRLEATAFAVGTGTSQPRGLVTAVSGTGPQLLGSSGASGAADLVAADIFALDNAVNPRWRSNGLSFLASRTVLNKIRALNNGNTPYQSTFWVDFGGALPSKLIGYNVYEVSDMDSTIVSGSNDDAIILGDVSQYYVIDRMGMSIQYNPMVVGGSGRRPTGEVGWVAFYRTGADVVTSNAFKDLRL